MNKTTFPLMNGKTLLMYTLDAKNRRIIYYLIIHGVEIQLTQNNLLLLLKYFKSFKAIKIVLTYLYEHNADMNCFKNNMKLIQLLNNFEEENDDKSNESDYDINFFKDDEYDNDDIEEKLKLNILRILIENHLDLQMKDENGKILFMNTMAPGNNLILRKYFKNITDVNFCDHSGKTLLMYACDFFNFELVKYLVDRGGEINKKDNNGKTPLIYSCQSRNNY